MSDEPLTPAEQDLARFAARTAPDALLGNLMLAADGGLPFYVSLLVNGMIVTGVLTPAEHMAEAIDAQRRVFADVAEQPEDSPDDEWAEQLERFATAASGQLAEYREDADKLDADLEGHTSPDGLDLDEVPAGLARRVMAHDTRTQITLRDARIFAPGQAGQTRVPAMRIPVARVAGWWLVPMDAQGRASFTFWQDHDDTTLDPTG